MGVDDRESEEEKEAVAENGDRPKKGENIGIDE